MAGLGDAITRRFANDDGSLRVTERRTSARSCRSERSVNGAKAAIVRSIFADYAAGGSAHKRRLNMRMYCCTARPTVGDHTWYPAARDRAAAQRALCPPADLKRAALRQGSAVRQAPRAGQPAT
jgi:hypothetical protein